jgi:hypothetical protein
MGAPIVVFGWTAREDLLQVVVGSTVRVRLVDEIFIDLIEGSDFDINGHVVFVFSHLISPNC